MTEESCTLSDSYRQIRTLLLITFWDMNSRSPGPKSVYDLSNHPEGHFKKCCYYELLQYQTKSIGDAIEFFSVMFCV